MWREGVRPLLAERTGGTLHSITLHVIGGESTLEAKGGKLFANENPTAAIYAKTGECHIRITARAKDVETAEVMCHQYAENFYALYGDAVYDEDVPGLEYTVVRLLAQKGWTAATAESCTGRPGGRAHDPGTRQQRGVPVRLCYLCQRGKRKAAGREP